jgi:hypothetical protein
MKMGTGYEARIFFEYHVSGKLYRSNRVILGESAGGAFSWSKTKAEKYLSAYPTGKEVKVLYNPNSPHDAYLERGEKYSTGTFAVAAGFLLLAVSLFIVYLLLK